LWESGSLFFKVCFTVVLSVLSHAIVRAVEEQRPPRPMQCRKRVSQRGAPQSRSIACMCDAAALPGTCLTSARMMMSVERGCVCVGVWGAISGASAADAHVTAQRGLPWRRAEGHRPVLWVWGCWVAVVVEGVRFRTPQQTMLAAWAPWQLRGGGVRGCGVGARGSWERGRPMCAEGWE
jgi:hypothetical protein